MSLHYRSYNINLAISNETSTHILNILLNSIQCQSEVATAISILKTNKSLQQIISLLNYVSKAFEKLLLIILNDNLIESNILPREQFRFWAQLDLLSLETSKAFDSLLFCTQSNQINTVLTCQSHFLRIAFASQAGHCRSGIP